MDKEKKTEIAQQLKNKGVHLPCPRCNAVNFEVVGQTSLPLHENLSVMNLKTSAVPAAMIACSNCGFITFHALGSLHLIPKDGVS